MDRHEHWQTMYRTHAPTEVGWYEPDPALSLRLVGKAVEYGAQSVIDIGGGASLLVDHLLEMGIKRIAVLDIAEAGIALAKERLAERAGEVEWIIGDVTAMEDIGRFAVWHDRAVFHFLMDEKSRRRYVALSERTVEPGGTAVMATFAHNGPRQCSGLPVSRYDVDQVAGECGPGWQLTHAESHLHTTPGGVGQNFLYSTFRRINRPS